MKIRYAAVAVLAAGCAGGPAPSAKDPTNTALLKNICMAAIVDGISYETATKERLAANARALGLTAGAPRSDMNSTRTSYAMEKPAGKYEVHVDTGLGADSCSIIPPPGATTDDLWAAIMDATPDWKTVTEYGELARKRLIDRGPSIVNLDVKIDTGMCGERPCISVLAIAGSPF